MVLFNTNDFLNRYILAIDGILISTTTPGHCGAGSKEKEGPLYILQISRTGSSPLDAI